MTARIDPAICWNCRHEAASKNLTCPCPFCHLVYLGSNVPAPTPSPGSFHGGGGRNPVAPPRPQTPTGSGGPAAPGRGHHRFNPFWAMAAIVVMGTGWGAVHGWHVSWVDVAAGGFFAAVCVGFGLWYERGGE